MYFLYLPQVKKVKKVFSTFSDVGLHHHMAVQPVLIPVSAFFFSISLGHTYRTSDRCQPWYHVLPPHWPIASSAIQRCIWQCPGNESLPEVCKISWTCPLSTLNPMPDDNSHNALILTPSCYCTRLLVMIPCFIAYHKPQKHHGNVAVVRKRKFSCTATPLDHRYDGGASYPFFNDHAYHRRYHDATERCPQLTTQQS